MPALSSAEKSEIRKKFAKLRADALAKRIADRKEVMIKKKEEMKNVDEGFDSQIADIDSDYYSALEGLHESLIAELEGRSGHYAY